MILNISINVICMFSSCSAGININEEVSSIIEEQNIEVIYKEKTEKDIFLDKFEDYHKIIWCYNTKTGEIKEINEKWNCFLWNNYQNITLPPKNHIEKYFLVYNNIEDIIKSLPTINFESSFNENAENKHAIWYVQTLKSYNIQKDIVSQLTWMKNRQDSQLNNKNQCWYYDWNEKDQLKCLYRYHYHSKKWYAYAEKSYKVYEYYKNYLWN